MNIWKLGTKWGADAPDFYEYILGEGIVLNHPSGGETAKKGDYMLVTRGFTVLAIAVLLEDVKPVTDNPGLEAGFAKHKIGYDDWVSYAKADYRVLSAEEQFRYEQRKGIVRIHDSLTIQRTLSLMGEIVLFLLQEYF
ncbi:hypothetical protein [Saprospira grandis]|uniref:ASCH domain-containing protein n=1 Tax=Saprospira grandis (strain Lewin) TaxID=984262 RepID=H6L7H2_SAPGL|nr:hypothetical protein [Saprospira grandis]AFC26844.1 hypothetical protein SGRA_4129 [Saprospira grandis str. Lewin]